RKLRMGRVLVTLLGNSKESSMPSRYRLPLFTIVSVVLIAAFALVGLSYGKFGAVNPAWTQTYNLGNGEGNGSLQLPPQVQPVNPGGAGMVGSAVLSGFNIYTFDTMVLLGVPCADVRVYRVLPDGNRLLHPSTCSGNIITFNAVGTGEYLFYTFGSPSAASN